MATKNLIEDLGDRYVREWLHSAYFLHEDRIHMLRTCDPSTVVTSSIPLTGNRDDRWVDQSLPASVLKDFSTFAYPKLGYRNITRVDGVVIPIHMHTDRSVHRGLRDDLIRVQLPTPVHYGLPHLRELEFEISRTDKVRSIFSPEFISFSTGIKQMLAGDLFAFAVSPEILVSVSCTESLEGNYDIRYKDKVVGTINMRGDISLSNKVLNRSSLRDSIFNSQENRA